MKKKIIISIAIALFILLTGAAIAFYPAIRFMMAKETITVDETLTLMLGSGSNSGIVVGDSAVVVIDTRMMGSSEDLYKFVKEKAGRRPIIVINTHYHPDHVKGNRYFKGSRIYIGNYGQEFLQKNIDAENMPTDVVTDSLLLDLGNEKVHLYNLGQAHTTNDLVVYLTNHNILFSGDLIFNQVNPVLMEESGAKVSRWINALDTILSRWGESKVVPGHGKVGDKKMVGLIRQYFIDMVAAATGQSNEYRMKDKYEDWMELPTMSSTEKTIEYIRKTEVKK